MPPAGRNRQALPDGHEAARRDAAVAAVRRKGLERLAHAGAGVEPTLVEPSSATRPRRGRTRLGMLALISVGPLIIWSLFTLLQAFATGLASLLLFRLGRGVAEAPCFPANSRIAGTRFPRHERATATGTYTVGEDVGLAVFSSVLFGLMASYGWHALLVAVGLGGLAPAGAEHGPFCRANVGRPLGYRQIWGAGIGQFAGNATLVFFLAWFPTYLATERHMGWAKGGFLAVLPFIAAAIGVMFGGWMSDRLFRRTGSATSPASRPSSPACCWRPRSSRPTPSIRTMPSSRSRRWPSSGRAGSASAGR